jgi:hypothetical protein
VLPYNHQNGGGHKTQGDKKMNGKKENGKDNSVINALKRLERAGSENSRATQKLHEAADKVAQAIINAVPRHLHGSWLPRDYRIVKITANIGEARYLVKKGDTDDWGNRHDYWIDGSGGYLFGDFNCPVPEQTREGSLLFAKDIADGLLDMISQHIEESQAKIFSATVVLEATAEKLASE